MVYSDRDTERIAKAAIEYAIEAGWREAAEILLNADLDLNETRAGSIIIMPSRLLVRVRTRMRQKPEIEAAIKAAIGFALGSYAAGGLRTLAYRATTAEPSEGWRDEISRQLIDQPGQVSNQAQVSSAVRKPPFDWNGLRFQSKSETLIAKALSEANVIFFPLPAAVAGVQKREPDFVVCADGKWGILEVMGDEFHTSEGAAKDHERGRWFQKYGIKNVHFYDATRCYSEPAEVVAEFLELLRSS